MTDNIVSQFRSAARGAFSGPGAKALMVGALVIGFLLPLSLVQRIVDDRRSTREAAEASIIGPAGGRPSFFGPFLALPYELRKDKELVLGEVLILPDELSITSTLSTEARRRGIFSAPVLSADLRIEGTLRADAEGAAPAGATLRWDEARLVVELPDLRALRETPALSWNGSAAVLRPEAGEGRAFARAASAKVAVARGASYPFSADVKLRGGRQLEFLEPAGAVRASLKGDWPSPSFFGYVAPTERSVSKAGFSASWFLPESAQGLPRAFDARSLSKESLSQAGFGVELLDGVDAYDMSWRAVRYGMLFIIVPFAALFLFELISRSRLHPVQYILIGLANCLFYLLLLSLSELIGFGWAYALAALACSGLGALYAAASLRSARGLFLFPALGLLYAYLYVALSSEDYALLIGSLGLLAILAAAMAATRKIDWYARRGAPAASPPPAPGPESEGAAEAAR
jgi:inner membrane protein